MKALPRLRLIFTLALALHPQASIAQTSLLLESPAEIQAHAEALLDKARQLSDLRSPGAPAFRLQAQFSFIGSHFETVRGTYTETWISNSQWRRETVMNDVRRIEVGDASHLWRLDSTNDFPEKAAQLTNFLHPFPAQSTLQFESVSEVPKAHPPADCVLTHRDASGHRSAFCFDKKTGLLIEKVSPEIRPRNAVANYCLYGRFEEFGRFRFPREMRCDEDRHQKIDAWVVDLSSVSSPDPALFTPPSGALELGNCADTPQPPFLISSPYPNPPSASREDETPSAIKLTVVVDINGKAQNIQVVQPGHGSYDQSAVGAVRQWRFKPASCHGEPIRAQVSVEVAFPLYH